MAGCRAVRVASKARDIVRAVVPIFIQRGRRRGRRQSDVALEVCRAVERLRAALRGRARNRQVIADRDVAARVERKVIRRAGGVDDCIALDCGGHLITPAEAD